MVADRAVEGLDAGGAREQQTVVVFVVLFLIVVAVVVVVVAAVFVQFGRELRGGRRTRLLECGRSDRCRRGGHALLVVGLIVVDFCKKNKKY